MRSNEQLVQEALLAQLSEYQHQHQQQLDELNPFTGAAKAAGAVSGAVKGAGQKVAGAAKRAKSAIGQAYQQGQTGAQKTVAGQDYKSPAAKTAEPKTAPAGQTAAPATANAPAGKKARGSGMARGVGDALRTLGRGIGSVGDIKSKIDSYDYAAGTAAQQRAKAAGYNSVGQHWDADRDAKDAAKAAGQAQTTPATQGTSAPTATTTSAPATATATGSAPKPTAVSGQPANKGAPPKVTSTGGSVAPKPTAVAGQPASKSSDPSKVTATGGAPTATDPKTATAPTSDTAKDIAAKTGAAAPTKKPNTQTVGGVKMDMNNPENANLKAAIDKAAPGMLASIDSLSAADKARLKKGLAA